MYAIRSYYVSGAHAYGFPSPDSDFDLKGAHVVPTECLLQRDSQFAEFETCYFHGVVPVWAGGAGAASADSLSKGATESVGSSMSYNFV